MTPSIKPLDGSISSSRASAIALSPILVMPSLKCYCRVHCIRCRRGCWNQRVIFASKGVARHLKPCKQSANTLWQHGMSWQLLKRWQECHAPEVVHELTERSRLRMQGHGGSASGVESPSRLPEKEASSKPVSRLSGLRSLRPCPRSSKLRMLACQPGLDMSNAPSPVTKSSTSMFGPTFVQQAGRWSRSSVSVHKAPCD